MVRIRSVVVVFVCMVWFSIRLCSCLVCRRFICSCFICLRFICSCFICRHFICNHFICIHTSCECVCVCAQHVCLRAVFGARCIPSSVLRTESDPTRLRYFERSLRRSSCPTATTRRHKSKRHNLNARSTTQLLSYRALLNARSKNC